MSGKFFLKNHADPHLYHCQETLSMTKVTNYPYNAYSFTDKRKMLCLFECSSLIGPVKLIKWVKKAHSFLQSVKSVPRYCFKLAYVTLQMTVKEFFETHF